MPKKEGVFLKMTMSFREEQVLYLKVLKARGLGPSEVIRRALDAYMKENPEEVQDVASKSN